MQRKHDKGDITLTYELIEKILGDYDKRKGIRYKLFSSLEREHIQEIRTALTLAKEKASAITQVLCLPEEELDYIPKTPIASLDEVTINEIAKKYNTRLTDKVETESHIPMATITEDSHSVPHIKLRNWYLLTVFAEFHNTLNQILAKNPEGKGSVEALRDIKGLIETCSQSSLLVHVSEFAAAINKNSVQHSSIDLVTESSRTYYDKETNQTSHRTQKNHSISLGELASHTATWENHASLPEEALTFTLSLAKSLNYLHTIQASPKTQSTIPTDVRLLQHAYTLLKLQQLNLPLSEKHQKILAIPIYQYGGTVIDTPFSVHTLIIALSEADLNAAPNKPKLLTEDRLNHLISLAALDRKYPYVYDNNFGVKTPVVTAGDMLLNDTYFQLNGLMYFMGDLQESQIERQAPEEQDNRPLTKLEFIGLVIDLLKNIDTHVMASNPVEDKCRILDTLCSKAIPNLVHFLRLSNTDPKKECWDSPALANTLFQNHLIDESAISFIAWLDERSNLSQRKQLTQDEINLILTKIPSINAILNSTPFTDKLNIDDAFFNSLRSNTAPSVATSTATTFSGHKQNNQESKNPDPNPSPNPNK